MTGVTGGLAHCAPRSGAKVCGLCVRGRAVFNRMKLSARSSVRRPIRGRSLAAVRSTALALVEASSFLRGGDCGRPDLQVGRVTRCCSLPPTGERVADISPTFNPTPSETVPRASAVPPSLVVLSFAFRPRRSVARRDGLRPGRRRRRYPRRARPSPCLRRKRHRGACTLSLVRWPRRSAPRGN